MYHMLDGLQKMTDLRKLREVNLPYHTDICFTYYLAVGHFLSNSFVLLRA